MKELIFCCIVLSLVCACPVKAAAPCAVPPPIAFEGSTQARWPATAKVHEKVLLRVDVPDLPQAGGYANVRVEWLERPQGKEPQVINGLPESDIIFYVPGQYKARVSVGYVRKTSCAMAIYQLLGEHTLTITLQP